MKEQTPARMVDHLFDWLSITHPKQKRFSKIFKDFCLVLVELDYCTENTGNVITFCVQTAIERGDFVSSCITTDDIYQAVADYCTEQDLADEALQQLKQALVELNSVRLEQFRQLLWKLFHDYDQDMFPNKTT